MTTTPPTINDQGDEEHPSFGVARLYRARCSPARRLFDSSIGHHEYVRLEIARATRTRSLHRDWIHGEVDTLIEVNMSLTQWGALVSSFNHGSGSPVTIARVGRERMPEADHVSRLAVTAREVSEAATVRTEQIRGAVEAIESAFEARAGRREMADLIRDLSVAVGNLPSNMRYVADSLTEHAEDVVSKARADIEAAQQYPAGLAGSIVSVPELEAPSGDL